MIIVLIKPTIYCYQVSSHYFIVNTINVTSIVQIHTFYNTAYLQYLCKVLEFLKNIAIIKYKVFIPQSQPTTTKPLSLLKNLQGKNQEVYLIAQTKHLPKVIFSKSWQMLLLIYRKLIGHNIYALGYIGAKLLCGRYS